jgi:hypothetical protein
MDQTHGGTSSPTAPIDLALRRIFPGVQETTQLQKARQIMGSDICGLSDDALEGHLTGFQTLIDSWLDEFEQHIFEGLTLRQVLGGK